MLITEHQMDIMKHAVGYSSLKEVRNWFGTSSGCKDALAFEDLVDKGLATSETPPSWMGDDVIYRVTPAGQDLLKD